ncbi:Orotidine 5'-phosphate decarboxylase (OMP decarboxylase) (OMPDCase) (OMPdecase) [Durusdinium trenchii]|uniref:Orotidine 5'-phosphate decarboxylase n=1 Tax=Durusdinium trenchii TaxID=1381693 RepID=A0ABP0L1V7_9DINO
MTDEGGAAKTDGKETEIDIPISVPADGAATGAEGAGAAAAPAEGAATESAADGAPAAPAETPADGAADPAAPAAPAEAPASGGDVSADASADPSAPAAPAGSAETPVDPAEPGAPAAPADGPAETPAAEDKVDDTGTGEAKPETDKVGDGGKTDDPKPPGEEEPKDSLLCVGLDPHKSELEEDSAEGAFRFCQRIIEETKDHAAAFKPNAAFFEVYGAAGWEALQRTLQLIPAEIPIVLDAKRGDIGSTSEAYASSAFQTLRCDSVTASPYLGGDGLQPFLKDASRGVWVLCKTSNPGSQDVQALELPNGEPLYLHVAKLCCGTWAKEHQNAGLVVGATDVEAMQKIRSALPDVWFLSPGIGAQGGDLPKALSAGLRSDGLGILLPISRGISRAESPKQMAETFRVEINSHRVDAPLELGRVETEVKHGGSTDSKDATACHAFEASSTLLDFGKSAGPGPAAKRPSSKLCAAWRCCGGGKGNWLRNSARELGVIGDFQSGLEAIPDPSLRSALEDWAQKMNLHVQELRTIMDGAAEPPVPPLPGTLEEETRAQVTEEELQSVRDIGRQLASHRTGRTTDAEEWTDPEESAKEVEELRRVRRQIRYIFGGMLQSLPEAGTLRVEPWLKE